MEQKVFHRKYALWWKHISSGIVEEIKSSSRRYRLAYVKRSDKRYTIEKLRGKGNEDKSGNDAGIKMRTCQRYVHIVGAIAAFPPIIQFGRRQFALTGWSVGVNFSQSIPLLHARSAVTRTRENPRARERTAEKRWGGEIDRATETVQRLRRIAIRANLIGVAFAGKSIPINVILIPAKTDMCHKLNC